MKSVRQKIFVSALAVVFTAAIFLWVDGYSHEGCLLVQTHTTGEVFISSGYGHVYGYWIATFPQVSWLKLPNFAYGFSRYPRRALWWLPHRREPIFVNPMISSRRNPVSPRLRYYFVPGFEFQVSTPDGDNAYFVIFPIWVIVAASGLPLAFKLRRLVRRSWRSSHGLCIACGYDLRHSKEKCPECGTIVQPGARTE